MQIKNTINYSGDFSTNFTLESLISKRFFDNTINNTLLNTSATTTVLNNNNRHLILNGSNESQVINLGDATNYLNGKCFILVSNNTEVISIVNNSGTEIYRLEPYNKVEFVLVDNSSSDGIWFKNVFFASIDKGNSLRDEFISSTTAGQTNWTAAQNGAGAGSSVSTTLLSSRSIIQLATGTTATGRSALHKSQNGVVFGLNKVFCYETNIAFPTLSTGTERYIAYAGYIDNIAAGDHLDGVYFEYDEGTSGNFWRLKTASNGTRTVIVTTVPVVANTLTKLRIEVNRAGTNAKFFINNVFINNITTNIPNTVGRNTDLGFKIEKTVGGTARTMLLDYVNENCYIDR